jgi:hypothetical protein
MHGQPWCAGQPDEVWREYADACGLQDSWRTAP